MFLRASLRLLWALRLLNCKASLQRPTQNQTGLQEAGKSAVSSKTGFAKSIRRLTEGTKKVLFKMLLCVLFKILLYVLCSFLRERWEKRA